MILTIGYRGVFRQEQYETVTIEASVTLDTDKDIPDRDLRGVSDVSDAMMKHLDTLTRPLIQRALIASRYGEDETVIYTWEGFINGTAGYEAPQRQQGRRVQRRR
jgi:hypothetical protein